MRANQRVHGEHYQQNAEYRDFYAHEQHQQQIHHAR
jgi:hypothetical protein